MSGYRVPAGTLLRMSNAWSCSQAMTVRVMLVFEGVKDPLNRVLLAKASPVTRFLAKGK